MSECSSLFHSQEVLSLCFSPQLLSIPAQCKTLIVIRGFYRGKPCKGSVPTQPFSLALLKKRLEEEKTTPARAESGRGTSNGPRGCRLRFCCSPHCPPEPTRVQSTWAAGKHLFSVAVFQVARYLYWVCTRCICTRWRVSVCAHASERCRP